MLTTNNKSSKRSTDFSIESILSSRTFPGNNNSPEPSSKVKESRLTLSPPGLLLFEEERGTTRAARTQLRVTRRNRAQEETFEGDIEEEEEDGGLGSPMSSGSPCDPSDQTPTTRPHSLDLSHFPWLTCTRFKPPKLPRSKKRGGCTKRYGRGPRIPFAPHQISVLESTFIKSQYLSSDCIHRLAETLHLSETRVKIWFQNRRARYRRENEALISSGASPEDDLRNGSPTGENLSKNPTKIIHSHPHHHSLHPLSHPRDLLLMNSTLSIPRPRGVDEFGLLPRGPYPNLTYSPPGFLHQGTSPGNSFSASLSGFPQGEEEEPSARSRTNPTGGINKRTLSIPDFISYQIAQRGQAMTAAATAQLQHFFQSQSQSGSHHHPHGHGRGHLRRSPSTTGSSSSSSSPLLQSALLQQDRDNNGQQAPSSSEPYFIPHQLSPPDPSFQSERSGSSPSHQGLVLISRGSSGVSRSPHHHHYVSF